MPSRVAQLEPELQSAKSQLTTATRDVKQQLDVAERKLNTQAISSQEAHELLQTTNDKLQKKVADRDTKIDNFAEQLVRLTS